jgi:hypothetical protein
MEGNRICQLAVLRYRIRFRIGSALNRLMDSDLDPGGVNLPQLREETNRVSDNDVGIQGLKLT